MAQMTVQVVYDPDSNPDAIYVGGSGNPEQDLKLLLEGVSVLAQALVDQGVNPEELARQMENYFSQAQDKSVEIRIPH